MVPLSVRLLCTFFDSSLLTPPASVPTSRGLLSVWCSRCPSLDSRQHYTQRQCFILVFPVPIMLGTFYYCRLGNPRGSPARTADGRGLQGSIKSGFIDDIFIDRILDLADGHQCVRAMLHQTDRRWLFGRLQPPQINCY